MHGLLDELSDFLARVRPDRFDGSAGLAEHDLALALALDKNRLFDANGFILSLGPAFGLDRGAVRILLVQFLKDLLPRDLGRQVADRRVRHLVLGLVKCPWRPPAGQGWAQIVNGT